MKHWFPVLFVLLLLCGLLELCAPGLYKPLLFGSVGFRAGCIRIKIAGKEDLCRNNALGCALVCTEPGIQFFCYFSEQQAAVDLQFTHAFMGVHYL